MRQRAARPSGILRIELPTALSRLQILPALGHLTARYPNCVSRRRSSIP